MTGQKYVIEEDHTLVGRASAVFSPVRAYRYALTRSWGAGPVLAWVMLNPSTGGAAATDPTLTRCTNFTRRWRFAGMTVVNLFALRSADPGLLTRYPDPVGDGNDRFIQDAAEAAAVTVAAWGIRGILAGRAAAVTRLLATGTRLHCLGRTKDGSPRHPLYMPANTRLQPFQPTPLGAVGEPVAWLAFRGPSQAGRPRAHLAPGREGAR